MALPRDRIGRRQLLHSGVAIAVILLTGAEPKVPPDHAEKMSRGLDMFTRQIRPLLLENCFKCHGGEKTRGGLDLTSRETLQKGGDNGPVLGERSAASKLYRLAAHLENPHMPPKSPRLDDQKLASVAAWIDLGAPYDKPLSEKAAAKKPMVVSDDDRQFWSFRPLTRPTPPPVRDETFVRTPVDRFILAKLDEKGLAPNPPIDRRHLLRRATFDLTGLPPTPEDLDSFVSDSDPRAYDKALDRLLASPAYGERWARHWLDLARYAESHGFEHDYDRPSAYHYRDFVIKALNMDMPYDRFVRLQLAGDELEPGNQLALMATGFLAAGVHSTQITANQVEKERYDELDDILRTTGTAMLGLTVGCARCHDHKYDPIPTRDYYRLLATFTTTVRSEAEMELDPDAPRRAKADFEREVEKQSQDIARRQADDAECKALKEKLEKLRKAGPRKTATKVLISSEGVPAVRLHTQGGDFLEQTCFLKRGDPNQKEGVAPQGFLQVLTRSPEAETHWQTTPPPCWHTSYRRAALAAWMTDAEQGAGALLARVVVNRLWQHHFGRGIVATPSDFGYQGERPSHPELLDWLAGELIANGWHLKPIHKLIMLSGTYAQGIEADARRSAVDPENRLLWRRVPRRLEAEAIRDAMLAVSGTLDRSMFGPGTLDARMKRRSIYFSVKRSQLVPAMVLFDAPDGLQGVEQRSTTTVAPQALLLLNNLAVRGYAEAFARRVGAANTPPADAVQSGYALALGRPPTSAETADSLQFLREQATAYEKDGKPNATNLALEDFCQALLSLNEFLYVD
jgi:mono/diheme cytochrome c family protein